MATELSKRLARQALGGELPLDFDPLGRDEPRLVVLSLDQIEPDPDQPRKALGELDELAESIREHGVLQPLIVQPVEGDRYRTLIGQRRYEACKIVGLQTLPCIVRTVEEHDRLALQLIENLHRKELTPIEEATALRRLIDEFHLTQRELAIRVGKSVASVNQTLRLLDLSPEILANVWTSEQLNKSVLLEIAKEPEPERQNSLLQQACAGQLTVREAKQRKNSSARSKKPSAVRSIVLPAAKVTIEFQHGEGTNAEIISALEEALALKRSE